MAEVSEATSTFEAARRAASDLRWSEAYALLRQVDADRLTPPALELLADAAWWCCRVEEEIGLRQQAFVGFDAAGDTRRAAYTAWMLSVRFGLRGDPVASSGWLARARRQLQDEPIGVEHGYVACSEVEAALGAGELDAAEEHARRAIAIGRRERVAELVALGVTWQGLCRLVRDEVGDGLGMLDEAMAAVIGGELDAHFTGWIACFAIGMCMSVADLRRAGSWAQAAFDWSSSLPEKTPYQGLCRVRQVEVMSLRGELDAAAVHAERSCEEMLAFEPNLAGEAFYVHGEILRRRGQLDEAERAFTRAAELGLDPQPGLARIRLAQGHGEAAAAALRAALTDHGRPTFQRAALLAADVEVALAADDPSAARASCDELDAVATVTGSEALLAMAGSVRGRLHLTEGDASAALAALTPAATTWRHLDLRFDLADTRRLIGLARRALGDQEGADRDLAAARDAFEQLGAPLEAARTAEEVADEPAGDPRPPGGLTRRECEVLALVAAGCTNRQVAAELVVSEHTVARHLSNIFVKLGVGSRTEAAGFAFAHGLVDTGSR